MLSTWDLHKSVPRDYKRNLQYRLWVLDKCREDTRYRSAMVHGCRNDLLFYINSFVWQYNPLKKGKEAVGPFITWPFQERALMMRPPEGKGILWCYENDKTAVVEKSREMGASWLFLIFQDWLCMFHPHVQAFNVSRSADAVDSPSKNSLFTKLRFMHKHLPDWLKGPLVEQKFYFEYKKSGSENTGEASTGRAGTGGRASVVFVDEFSEIKEDVKVRQNTASVADCRFFNGTHLGVGTEFYNLTQSPEFVQIRMHWTRHPRKNKHLYSWDVDKVCPVFWRYDAETDEIVPSSQDRDFPEDYPFDTTGGPSGGPHPGIRSPWYDQKAAEIGTSRQVAMELDINPTGSASQFYEPLVIRRLVDRCRPHLWQGDLDHGTDDARPFQLVPGNAGPLRLWLEPGMGSEGRLNRTPPAVYVVAADLGYGNGATPSCLTIFNVSIGQKIGTYTHFWKDSKQMAWLAVSMCRLFKNADGDPATLIWECPGPGLMFGDEVLKELNYRNIYWKTELFNDEERQSDSPGWYATTNSRLKLHTDYLIALKTGVFVNHDEDALKETLSYVHGSGSVEHPKAKRNADPSAAGSSHGDHVVADALAWMMAKRIGVGEKVVVEEKPPTVRSILGRRQFAQRLQREADVWV